MEQNERGASFSHQTTSIRREMSVSSHDFSLQTLQHLYNASLKYSLISPSLSRILIRKLACILKSHKLDLAPSIAPYFCKHCATFLLPAVTCTVTVSPKVSKKLKKQSVKEKGVQPGADAAQTKKPLKIIKNQTVYKCLECGNENIFVGILKDVLPSGTTLRRGMHKAISESKEPVNSLICAGRSKYTQEIVEQRSSEATAYGRSWDSLKLCTSESFHTDSDETGKIRSCAMSFKFKFHQKQAKIVSKLDILEGRDTALSTHPNESYAASSKLDSTQFDAATEHHSNVNPHFRTLPQLSNQSRKKKKKLEILPASLSTPYSPWLLSKPLYSEKDILKDERVSAHECERKASGTSSFEVNSTSNEAKEVNKPESLYSIFQQFGAKTG